MQQVSSVCRVCKSVSPPWWFSFDVSFEFNPDNFLIIDG